MGLWRVERKSQNIFSRKCVGTNIAYIDNAQIPLKVKVVFSTQINEDNILQSKRYCDYALQLPN